MKLGIHLSLWAKEFTDSFLDDIDKAASKGFDCVEIPLMDPEKVPVKEVKKRLDIHDLDVYCGTGLGPETDISSADSAIREKGEQHLLCCLEKANEIGSPSLGGVIHSAWGKRERISAEDRHRSASVLRRVATRAKELDMKLALECINRYESSFLNTVDQGLSLLNEISMANIGLHLDTYHMNIEEESIISALIRAESRLFHIHLSENNRGFPGSGLLNWKEIIETLSEIDYSGDLVIESYIEPDTPVGDAVCIWREIEKGTDQSLQKSVDFLRTLL